MVKKIPVFIEIKAVILSIIKCFLINSTGKIVLLSNNYDFYLLHFALL